MIGDMSLFALSGRTAIVTGSGRNIGRAIACLLARFGANVIINGHRDEGALRAVAEEIRTTGGNVLPILTDASCETGATRLVAAGEESFGKIDIVISNLGLRTNRPFLDLTVAEWREALDVNLNASFFLARAALPGMKDRGWGRFVHLSGSTIYSGVYPGRTHVLASKRALQGLSVGLAYEFGPYGITSNIVAPGVIETDRDWSQYPNLDIAAIAQSTPARRLGQVDDIAAACLYLVSDAGAFVTGQTLHVNGGRGFF